MIDVETSGLNPATDALLEIAAVTLATDSQGNYFLDKTYSYHVDPFPGAHFDPESMIVTGIDPYYPLRYAVPEKHALHRIFTTVQDLLVQTQCQRAVLVGHNAWFDLAFLLAAAKRAALPFNPFHSFTTFDTATLAAVALGETVLAKALRAAQISFDADQAHSAIYDAEKTAQLFCYIVNGWCN